ncbi:MAG: thermonuclease family protein [Magnetovibrio sp.]|nr:thermonuclease family protein [Magnetovibrio sp.]
MAKVAVIMIALSPVCAFGETDMTTTVITITGPARIIDGDTLEILGEVHRLHGIDAPERAQTCQTHDGGMWLCGRRASQALRDHVAGRDVTCYGANPGKSLGRYGRHISKCYVHDQDVGAWMVSQGWALAYRRYADDYVHREVFAKGGRRGLWSGGFIPPWIWRRTKSRKSR